jgi:hypothetical protein
MDEAGGLLGRKPGFMQRRGTIIEVSRLLNQSASQRYL